MKQFKRETIFYNRKEISCCILKRYSSGFEKSKGYLIAEVTEKTPSGEKIRYNISEVTKRLKVLFISPGTYFQKQSRGKTFSG